ncbi:hypothetical protein L7F22_060293 [Adiantum nelumboides]|nr:hypothetical protein [Adiantum nelumboides]
MPLPDPLAAASTSVVDNVMKMENHWQTRLQSKHHTRLINVDGSHKAPQSKALVSKKGKEYKEVHLQITKVEDSMEERPTGNRCLFGDVPPLRFQNAQPLNWWQIFLPFGLKQQFAPCLFTSSCLLWLICWTFEAATLLALALVTLLYTREAFRSSQKVDKQLCLFVKRTSFGALQTC